MPVTESSLLSYNFVDTYNVENQSVQDVNNYTLDRDLGRGIGIVAVVKWTNQVYHDNYLRSLLSGGWDASLGLSNAPNNRARSRYYEGLIARSDLDTDSIQATDCDTTEMLQPTGFDHLADGSEVYASANCLVLQRLGGNATARVIQNPWFARLHSAEFNEAGDRVLTASSALDVIYEVDIKDGKPSWSLDVWEETPLRQNIFGQSLYRHMPLSPCLGDAVLHNPDPLYLKDNDETRGATCVIDDPSVYRGLGLPTALMPAFVNSVSYGLEDTVLATSYQRGEGWVIDRANQVIKIIAKGMKRPHGLHLDPLLEGYMVTDTVGEKAIYLSSDLKRSLVIDFAHLPGMKPGLEKAGWLQYTTRIAPDTYCAVLTSRQMLVVFDPVRRLRREVAIDPQWGVQLIANPSLRHPDVDS